MENKKSKEQKLLPLAFEVGWTIALPLVGLALLGRWADKIFHASPIFLLTGSLLAIIISTIIILKKVQKLF
ncbi:MAG: AtpZ/AtpI family protein [Candidatus Paceibacterota bacterium]|jgi:F0F1-type ATP synthase assembly protein I